MQKNNNVENDVCECSHIHQDAIKGTKHELPSDDEIIALSERFQMLSDMTRLKIVLALIDKELCVCDICEIVGLSQSAISHQLRVLRYANLVKYRRSGKLAYYSIDDEHVLDIIKLSLEHLRHTK